jgi:hypothetical protein
MCYLNPADFVKGTSYNLNSPRRHEEARRKHEEKEKYNFIPPKNL